MPIEGTVGYAYEYQDPAVLNQAAPVQNTWYTLLDTTNHCRIQVIGINVEDANETLDLKITVDGETINTAVAATHSTNYYPYVYVNAITQAPAISFPTTVNARAYIIEGHSVKVELRKTTAAGAGNLTGIVVYGVLKRAY